MFSLVYLKISGYMGGGFSVIISEGYGSSALFFNCIAVNKSNCGRSAAVLFVLGRKD